MGGIRVSHRYGASGGGGRGVAGWTAGTQSTPEASAAPAAVRSYFASPYPIDRLHTIKERSHQRITSSAGRSSGSSGLYSLDNRVQQRHLRRSQHWTGGRPHLPHFATFEGDRFDGLNWSTWETGAPILQNVISAIDCRREATHDAGDHVIMVGLVVRAEVQNKSSPLLYFKGSYEKLETSSVSLKD